jgi:protein-S-isoprenylcysteine O-methyltransferase Ste14
LATSSPRLVGASRRVRQTTSVEQTGVSAGAGRSGPFSRDLSDIVAKAMIAGLFLGLAYRIGLDVLESGRPTGLLLLASELLVVVLTLSRRAAIDIDLSCRVRLIAVVSILGPFLLRPTSGIGPSVEAYTVTVSTIGLAIVVAGKVALGRSFGLLPANRGVVSSGAYRLVRHPIYLGYVLTHAAFLAANPSWWNVVALAAADSALLIRASHEEGTLLHDPVYARYRQRVRWRLVPGVF